MATIYNTELIKEVVRGARIQQSTDRIPNVLGDVIIPTMEVNPHLLRIASTISHNSAVATGAITVLTTQNAARDFYLTGIEAAFIKDATCDQATGLIEVQITVEGQTKRVIQFPIITLTAQTDSIVREFAIPIKLDRNTSIAFTGTYTVGVMSRACCVTGYYLDNPNA